MDHTDGSIGSIENWAGSTIRRRLVTVMIRDEGVFKVPGSRNGNRNCACALLLIPSFLQLLVLDPETAKLPVRRKCLHFALKAD